MGTACEIRIAREDDADAVSRVILSALRDTNAKDYAPEIIAQIESNFSPAAVRDLMGRRRMFVAVREQQIIGTASLEGRRVRSVFVAPIAQRTGIGTRLMAEVDQAARQAGIAALVVQSSVTAEQFYARLGFTALRDSFHGDERTIIMERPLTAA